MERILAGILVAGDVAPPATIGLGGQPSEVAAVNGWVGGMHGH
jgi:hypothetical protein